MSNTLTIVMIIAISMTPIFLLFVKRWIEYRVIKKVEMEREIALDLRKAMMQPSGIATTRTGRLSTHPSFFPLIVPYIKPPTSPTNKKEPFYLSYKSINSSKGINDFQAEMLRLVTHDKLALLLSKQFKPSDIFDFPATEQRIKKYYNNWGFDPIFDSPPTDPKTVIQLIAFSIAFKYAFNQELQLSKPNSIDLLAEEDDEK